MVENTRKRPLSAELGFIHEFIPASTRPDQVTLLLLHGTGGNEQDLIPLEQQYSVHAERC
jgi:predicted esterase